MPVIQFEQGVSDIRCAYDTPGIAILAMAYVDGLEDPTELDALHLREREQMAD